MKRINYLLAHAGLIGFIIFMFIPLYLAIVAASHEGSAMMQAPLPLTPGTVFFTNLKTVLIKGIVSTGGQPLWQMLVSSLIMASLIAAGKIMLALISAFALVYFQLPYKHLLFGLIFSTLMLPVEVRIVPTFQVVA